METFVVRIWRAVGDGRATPEKQGLALRGLVERLGAAKPTPFRSGEELLRLLQESSPEHVQDSVTA